MAAKVIMVQGTASHVGKSVLVAALCRIFSQEGYRVAPYKSQNMALNSFVTRNGGEIGRAQAFQAEAAGIEPTVDMNPILLKPTGQATSQVIVLGKPVGNFSAQQYHDGYAKLVKGVIKEAFERLSRDYEIIVIEGAGSPAEVNLQETEIVNMYVARMTGAPVLLVADIDKGGALASIVGTLELLPPDDRKRVAGIIINKFRGDLSLFQPAIDFLETRTGKQVLGVVPYFNNLRIQEEDTIPEIRRNDKEKQDINIEVIRLPHISNFTDFDPLEDEPDVWLQYVEGERELGFPDLIIIPGSKNTIEDLEFLKRSGLAQQVIERARSGIPVIGICGGFQMLGEELHDPLHTESYISWTKGLGLLEVTTTFEPDKLTNQVEAEVVGSGPFFEEVAGQRVTGYEIHMGRTILAPGTRPAFNILFRSGEKVSSPDGAVSKDGVIFGTYIHGIFDNDFFRRHIIDVLRLRKGLGYLSGKASFAVREQQNKDLNRLADIVRGGLDLGVVYSLLNLR